MNPEQLINPVEEQPEPVEETQEVESAETEQETELLEEKPGVSDENKDEQTEQPELHQVKWTNQEGKEVVKELPLDELKADYQLKQASYAKFQEAKKMKDEATNTVALVKQDPIGAHKQLCGPEATRDYLWNVLHDVQDPEKTFIDTLIDVYGSDEIQPEVVKFVNRVMEEEHLRINNPEEFKRRQSVKQEQKQFLTEKQKIAQEKQQLEEWKRAKEAEDATKAEQSLAKQLFTEIQQAISKAKLPTHLTSKDEAGQPKKVPMLSVVAKYMEIYENAEGRSVSAEETVSRMKQDFVGLGLAELQALPEGELLNQQPDLAKKLQNGVREKISSTRSTRPKKEGKDERKQQSPRKQKPLSNVHQAPWRHLDD
jgi:hypothetical protein